MTRVEQVRRLAIYTVVFGLLAALGFLHYRPDAPVWLPAVLVLGGPVTVIAISSWQDTREEVR